MNEPRPDANAKRRPAPPEEDLFQLKDGAHDPELNKRIHQIILVCDTFIVYLASDLSVQWRTTDRQSWVEGSGTILNRVAILESRSGFVADRRTLEPIRRQIAEGLVRCLDGGDIVGANTILDEVEDEIQARNREISWSWYFSAAYWVALGCAAAIAVLWLVRDPARELIGANAFEVLVGTMFGAIGALLSATVRGNRIHLDANAGERIHRLEGLSRIGAGLVGAAVVALGIKSGALLGGTRFEGSQFALLLMFCIVAGASERLVPGLIEHFEKLPAASVEGNGKARAKLPRRNKAKGAKGA